MQFTIRERIIKCTDESLIGDNADYAASFTFDSEWDGKVKTARFQHVNKGIYCDVILQDDACTIPAAILKAGFIRIGVFTDAMTSTHCEMKVVESIKEKNGSPAAPSYDVYAQIIGMIENIETSGVTEEEVDAKIEDAKSEFYNKEEIDDKISNLDVDADYPQYSKDEMNVVADKVKGFISTINNPVIVGFNTDQHLYANPTSETQTKLTKEIVYGLRTLRDMTKKVPFNFVVLGGDTVGGGSTIKVMQDATNYVIEQMKGACCPFVCLTGNHEGGQNNNTITLPQVFKSHITPSVANKVVSLGGLNCNSYFDDVTANVRFIFVNSYIRSGIHSIATIREFVGSALSTMPSDYNAIIFSHHPLDTNLPYSADKTQWNSSISLQDTLIPYKDRIICCVNGHTHNNLSAVCDGIRFISTTCAGRFELNDKSTRPYDSAEATAYDVLVIDQESKQIHCIRYGNGEDRSFDYGGEEPEPTPTYTNVIPLSIDTDGSIYNGVGYETGKRLNSNGAVVDYTNCGVTGFISIANGDIVRLSECNMSSTDTGRTYIAFYDASFAKINSATAKGSSYVSDRVVDDSGYITQYTVNASNAKYMRVSADGIGASAIITINEVIE